MSAANQALQLIDLSYQFNNGKTIFSHINLTLAPKKIGLIGRNGLGKSTLLKLMAGELVPSSGQVLQHDLTFMNCPQDQNPYLNETIAEILGFAPKLRALKNIERGSTDIEDFDCLAEDWNCLEQMQQQLCLFNLENLSAETKLSELSGGQRTAVFLIKCFFSKADFLILDEPTNNLDKQARKKLYAAIRRSNKGFLIVSHDRKLLEHMEQLVELTSLGINTFGGNYSFYKEQKQLMLNAAQQGLELAKKEIKQTKANIQSSQEKHEQRQSKGKKVRKSRGQAKVILDSMKGRSEKTQCRLLTKNTQLTINSETSLKEAKEKFEIIPEFNFDLEKTYVPSSKVVLEIEALAFQYDPNKALIHDFNLKLLGPERIALTGCNGSGKSTLLQLILQQLVPQNGCIKLNIQNMSYLDQHCTQLNSEQSILDNFIRMNPDINNRDAHFALASFLFRNRDADKLVRNLSGGEKLRALLACVLFSKTPPQLLILDEPTNHLDLHSIEVIENALKCYQGAMIIISHDEEFLERCSVDRYVEI